jgi:arsenate reductase (glutaredoxin)
VLPSPIKRFLWGDVMKIYGLKKCSTCQKALAFLADKKVDVDFMDHSEIPPTKTQIASWSKAVGGWEKLINRAGYTWRGLPASETEGLTEAKAVALAATHTSLIRRPLIEHVDGTVTVGFTDKVKALF